MEADWEEFVELYRWLVVEGRNVLSSRGILWVKDVNGSLWNDLDLIDMNLMFDGSYSCGLLLGLQPSCQLITKSRPAPNFYDQEVRFIGLSLSLITRGSKYDKPNLNSM